MRTRCVVALGAFALLVAILSAASAAAATGLTDTASHPPPTSGPYAWGTFTPTSSGFPSAGGTFVDPVFGTTITRLTNEAGQGSFSEIYSRNGWFSADGTLVHHRTPAGRTFLNTSTGQVVRANVPGNFDSSFASDNPDAWYYWVNGSPDLKRYSVSTGQGATVKTFPGPLGPLGGSVDWIDRSGRYMVLRIAGSVRVYEQATDKLYAGALPSTKGTGGGWAGISPDGNYVITSTPGVPLASSESWRIDHQAKTVSTVPVLYWTMCGGHADVVTASNGRTYHVSLDCHTTAALYAVDVSLPQSRSNTAKQLSDNKKLVQLTWSDDIHVSRVSRGRDQDWAFVSVKSGDDSATVWRPYKSEILMVNVLTGETRRIAHHRSRSLSGNYFAQPRVSSSWDGRVVAWASNFGTTVNGYADIYAVSLGAVVVPPPPVPPPDPEECEYLALKAAHLAAKAALDACRP